MKTRFSFRDRRRDDILYSGTVAGALEAVVYGLPGLAVSQVGRGNADFERAAEIATMIAERIMAKGLPERTVLSVNIPSGPPKGLRITRQGSRVVRTQVLERVDPRGGLYYWIGQESSTWYYDELGDYEAVRSGYISVTPLQNDLTNEEAFHYLSSWRLDQEVTRLMGKTEQPASLLAMICVIGLTFPS